MKCEGCGIDIQTIERNEDGYLPESVFIEKTESKEILLCQRCFKLKHYNQLMPVKLNSNFYPQLKSVLKDFKTIIWVVDIIDFEGTYREEIINNIKNKNIILLINKVDLLPNTISYSVLKEWVLKRIGKSLNIKRENIRIISSKNNFGINGLRKKLLNLNEEKILITGVTNTGKSSILNKLCESNITVSSYPGTTLKLIASKMKASNINFYDTPGIELNDRFCDLFDIFSQVKMIPKKQMNINKYNIEPNRIIFLSKFIYFKIIDYAFKNQRPIFSVFTTDNILIHETNESKIEELTSSNNSFLFPPYDKNFDISNIDIEKKQYVIEKGKELVIPGLGWINVIRGPLKIDLFKPKMINTVIRDKMLNIKGF